MIQIEGLEIRYFRSIQSIKLNKLTDLLVLSGRNDVGKSNILKALNLFFNNETDWKTPVNFSSDFSKQRLAQVRKETVKGKQFIQVTVHFLRGSRYEKSLPPRFSVTRTWFRGSVTPEQKSSLEKQHTAGEVPTKNLDRAIASLGMYLNSVRFEYIPAVKDQMFFVYVLGRLQDIILGNKSGETGITDAVEKFNTAVVKEAAELREEFLKVTGIPTTIELPNRLDELFRAFTVATSAGGDTIPLNARGDGVRSRFLPSLLHYIARHSSLKYIWGFEEPENSLEMSLSAELAGKIQAEYSVPAQILLTSHSPAFFGLRESNTSTYRVFFDERKGTDVARIFPSDARNKSLVKLERELGLMEFQEQFQEQYNARLLALKKRELVAKSVIAKMNQSTQPILLTEGKWDALILAEAWKRLRKKACPFKIIPCDPVDGESGGGSGGVSTLKACLETVRGDEPVSIGLFDNDKEGREKGFAALGRFFEQWSTHTDVKIRKDGVAAAILLPPFAGREKYAEANNFPLEFYFSDADLAKQVNGKGLLLEFPKVEQIVQSLGVRLEPTIAAEPHLRRVNSDSKAVFAEVVVPSLDDAAFGNFENLFNKMEAAFKHLESIRTKNAKGRPRSS